MNASSEEYKKKSEPLSMEENRNFYAFHFNALHFAASVLASQL